MTERTSKARTKPVKVSTERIVFSEKLPRKDLRVLPPAIAPRVRVPRSIGMSDLYRSTRRAGGELANVFARYLDSGQLTVDGYEWLIAALDPFHDFQYAPEGYPDNLTAKSVTRIITYAVTILPPSNVGTGKWDCNIAIFPSVGDSEFGAGANYYCAGAQTQNSGGALTISDYIGAGQTLSGVCYVTAPTGTATFFNGAQMTGNTYSVPLNFSSSDYINAPTRILGVGFEVIDPSAALTLSGDCRTYTQPVGLSYDSSEVLNTGIPHHTFTFVGPPRTLQEAQLLSGDESWKANQGAYVVGHFSSSINPPQYLNFSRLLIRESSGTLASQTAGVNAMFDTNSIQYGATNIYRESLGGKLFAPLNSSGAYFTGLATTDSLTLTVKYIIEQFPGCDDPTYTLARPSPVSDPFALMLYNKALQSIPAGCPQGMNPRGEWWRKILKAVVNVAPMAGAVASLIPGAEAAAPIAEIASSVARNMYNRSVGRAERRGDLEAGVTRL